jgi:hypothetical protein
MSFFIPIIIEAVAAIIKRTPDIQVPTEDSPAIIRAG